jgi:hypothetical protein
MESSYGNPPTTGGTPQGVAVIFDSSDGGIVAATLPTLKQLTAGALSPENFWKQCYFDPPEAFQEP